MNAALFKLVYNAVRNGCNEFYFHPMVRSFQYSDGVRDLAATGCYWLLDVLATELPAKFRKFEDVSNTCSLTVKSKNSKATIVAEFEDGKPGWTKRIEYTDLPEGKWQFHAADEGGTYKMILLTEY
jgi:hypothetical protein